jgi:MraZ protein
MAGLPYTPQIMSSFKGSDTYIVDAKGRVSIPSKMRRNIEPSANLTFIVTRGLEKCLYAYPLDEWRSFEESIRLLSSSNEKDRFFVRTLMQWSEEVTLDSQFRLLVPKAMMDFAEIKKEVFFIGVLDHIELWKPENFKKYIESKKDSYEKVVEHVMGTRKN